MADTWQDGVLELPDLQLWCPLDEDLPADLSGNPVGLGYGGSVPTITQANPAGTALGNMGMFSGGQYFGSYINFTNSESLNPDTRITIGFWLNPTTLPLSNSNIVTKASLSGGTSYVLSLRHQGDIRLELYSEDQGLQAKTFYSNPGLIAAGNWYWIVVQVQIPTSRALWVNGSQVPFNVVAQSNPITQIQQTTSTIGVSAGYDTGFPFRFYPGLMDELLISHDLCGAQMAALYALRNSMGQWPVVDPAPARHGLISVDPVLGGSDLIGTGGVLR